MLFGCFSSVAQAILNGFQRLQGRFGHLRAPENAQKVPYCHQKSRFPTFPVKRPSGASFWLLLDVVWMLLAPFWALEDQFRLLLGALWAALGSLFSVPGHLLNPLRALRGALGTLWAAFGTIWRTPGRSRVDFGRIWDRFSINFRPANEVRMKFERSSGKRLQHRAICARASLQQRGGCAKHLELS